MIGWEQTNQTSYHRTWLSKDGRQHVIVVALLQDGWSYKWQRGYGMTVGEASGFPTLEACMHALWAAVFSMFDHYHDLLVADARRIVGAS